MKSRRFALVDIPIVPPRYGDIAMSDSTEHDAMTSDTFSPGSNTESSPNTLMATDHSANTNSYNGQHRNLDDQSAREKEKEKALEVLSGKIYEAYKRISFSRPLSTSVSEPTDDCQLASTPETGRSPERIQKISILSIKTVAC